MKRALVTGSAGFIGYHLSHLLLQRGWHVTGVDNLSDYYDPELKRRRHARLGDGFTAVIGDVATPGLMTDLLAQHRPDAVIHLAAQAGVRHSIDAPRDYVEANLLGTYEVLEAARAHPPAHLLIASTSSVYGANADMPYRETVKADTQMSFYAATKKAGEAMAHSYAHLYGVPTTLFRFFTVYGPWGRPDMALFKFVRAILNGQPIDVYNHGRMRRDFTYVGDLVQGIADLIGRPPGTDPVSERDSLSPVAPHRIVNIGNGETVELGRFIEAIEGALGTKATRNLMDMQPGDVPATWADCGLLTDLLGHALPRTPVEEGVRAFVDWYRDEYRS
ncbi:NAD-dependent epimerase/dehydratase family protein [Jannaschia sp. S6380]|uniref:NAD-dependent epimerase/dehydratase family protein n=1 Tax=Jannaschia sp. S6380 TaxID=2926408 RepID=UPI001FF3A2B9|nr:NAD-dependent epimerase/dehydratase family protein [Jannaschia sp. S6380]MCK0168691.1 NAD-dependent epimerase/dehydratase family protein [Jannaschia sp. S6380]